jgi:hypothetical protein
MLLPALKDVQEEGGSLCGGHGQWVTGGSAGRARRNTDY